MSSKKSQSFLKLHFIFNCVYVKWMKWHILTSEVPMEAKISDLLVQEIVSHSIQVLEPKLRSSARAASGALNC